MSLPPWLRVIGGVAALRVLAGLPGPLLALEPLGRPAFSIPIFLAIIVVFSGIATFLLVEGKGELRAEALALVFLLAAAPFTDGLLGLAAAGAESVRPALLVLRALQVDSFMPFAIWLFVREFPSVETYGPSRWVGRAALGITLGVGVLLFGANLVAGLGRAGVLDASWTQSLWAVDRLSPQSRFYPILLALMVPAPGFALWRSRIAGPEERRRVQLLIAAVLVGIVPTSAIVIAFALLPGLRAIVVAPGVSLSQVIAYTTMMMAPLLATHAVLVHHALGLKLMVRKAVQYSMAHLTVRALALLPLGVVGVVLYASRTRTLSELMSGPSFVVLAVAVGLVGTAVAGRRRLLDEIDERFFREQFDAQKLLRELIEEANRTSSVSELPKLLHDKIVGALHVESVRFYYVDSAAGVLVAPEHDLGTLKLFSDLATQLASARESVAVDWERDSMWVASLPLDDQRWLAEGGFTLLIPLNDDVDGLLGVVGLGPKRSELPFSAEDRDLLGAVAGTLTSALRDRLLPATSGRGVATSVPGRACRNCGRVQAPPEKDCGACRGTLEDATVPAVLAGKYLIKARVGRGGMGVVYHAKDDYLGRDVAVKTLPGSVSPGLSQRLRREARAMARAKHANLADIYAVEFWKGTPMLVVEYLPRGTLRDRLDAGAIGLPDVVAVGAAIADASSCIHDFHILHRDIKPANIGFGEGGEPKLLDFGLAQMVEAADAWSPTNGDALAAVRAGGAATDGPDATPAESPGMTEPHRIVGTVPYMSPEAIDGEEPTVAFDLWSIGVVLYEAVSGRRPVEGGNLAAMRARICTGDFPDVTDLRPDVPSDLARLIRDSLHMDPDLRPQKAREVRRRLLAIQL